MNDETSAKLKKLAAARRLHPSDKDYLAKLAYVQTLAKTAGDGRFTDDELLLVKQIETTFDIDADYVRQARLEIYRTIYLDAVADHELTDDEASALSHFQHRLDIATSQIEEELQFLDQLRDLRMISQGTLPSIPAPFDLGRGEVCHFRGDGRLLKSRIQSTFQRDGQKYKVRGLEVDKEGELLVTNKRILLVHSGTTSIPLATVLDIEVDWDRQLLTIARDGIQTPTLFTTPEAAKAGAIISRLTVAAGD